MVVVGGVFVIEAVSVILQVLSFKLTGKRFFAMSPLHHHFELTGWKESTVGIKSYDDLPDNARKYLERLQSLVGVPITIISTGPDREQTIIRQNPFG